MRTKTLTPVVGRLADQYEVDCLRPDAPPDPEIRLRGWLWFTCPADLRIEVEHEIKRREMSERGPSPDR